jgi:hypothetical protein
MRRGGLLAGEGEILAGCSSAKGSVGAVVVIEMREGIDMLVEMIEPVGQVVTGIEFVPP